MVEVKIPRVEPGMGKIFVLYGNSGQTQSDLMDTDANPNSHPGNPNLTLAPAFTMDANPEADNT